MEWTLSAAKAHFSEVCARAMTEGAQTIVRRGRSGETDHYFSLQPIAMPSVQSHSKKNRLPLLKNTPAEPDFDNMWDYLAHLRKTSPINATLEEMIAWKNEGRR